MQSSICLKYSGPAVDAGTMNVYDAAANMIAFSEFISSAAKTTFGEKADVKAEVAGFEHGSFMTNLVISVGGVVVPVLASADISTMFEVVKGSIGLWRFLQGKEPREVEQTDNGIKVTNNNGQIQYFNADTVNLVFNEKATDAVGKFVRDALSKDGVDSLAVHASVNDSPAELMTVAQSESQWFVPVALETPIFDQTIPMILLIESPVFKDGNKWRFYDGANSFSASIEDEEFLQKVEDGEAFAKGDSLHVELRINQVRKGDKLSTEKTVVRVLEHKRKSRSEQGGLFHG